MTTRLCAPLRLSWIVDHKVKCNYLWGLRKAIRKKE